MKLQSWKLFFNKCVYSGLFVLKKLYQVSYNSNTILYGHDNQISGIVMLKTTWLYYIFGPKRMTNFKYSYFKRGCYSQ